MPNSAPTEPEAISSPPQTVDPTTPLTGPEPLSSAATVQPSRFTHWARTTLGLDRAVLFTIFARGWGSLAGIITLALIARSLSPAEQGFYYTFYSLVALQIVFELGFSTVILQTASHEAAYLRIESHGGISGPARSHNRLASVLQKAVRWYTTAAILMACVLLPAGLLFFRQHASAASPVAYALPWTLVVLASSCTFQIDPTFSFLEGCGYISAVARTRLAQGIAGSLLGWAALFFHHGLFAPALIIFGQAAAGALFLYRKRFLLLPLLRRDAAADHIDWRSEVWPFQWRIAVSWISGYFGFQFFIPVIFADRGAVEAGQLGMSLNVCTTLSGIAIAWINTKASVFGRLIARRAFAELDRLFFRALAQSLATAVLACLSVWIVVAALRQHGVPLASRLLPPVPLAMLFATTAINIILFAEAIYLRAHKQEKFMAISVVGAVVLGPASILIGKHFGAAGVCLAYFAGTLFVGLGWGTHIFLKWRRIWHAA